MSNTKICPYCRHEGTLGDKVNKWAGWKCANCKYYTQNPITT